MTPDKPEILDCLEEAWTLGADHKLPSFGELNKWRNAMHRPIRSEASPINMPSSEARKESLLWIIAGMIAALNEWHVVAWTLMGGGLLVALAELFKPKHK